MGFFSRLFHRHEWKLVSADVSTHWNGFAATVTLECVDCNHRQCFMKGHRVSEIQFPSRGAAKVWIESLLPNDHPKIKWTREEKIE